MGGGHNRWGLGWVDQKKLTPNILASHISISNVVSFGVDGDVADDPTTSRAMALCGALFFPSSVRFPSEIFYIL